MSYQVGDDLILVPSDTRRTTRNVTVTRIGRKYLYAKTENGELSARFHIATGAEDANYGSPDRLYTRPEFDDMRLRKDLIRGLRESFGLRLDRPNDWETGHLQSFMKIALRTR